MTNKADIEMHYVRKTTAMAIAFACAVAGFLAGMFYSSIGRGAEEVRRTVEAPPANVQKQQPQAGQVQNQAQLFALRQEVEKSPGNAGAWARLGHYYFDSEQRQEAVDAYKKSLELQPGNPNVLTDMGVMYRQLGNPREAVRCFDKAGAADSLHQQSRLNKGVVLMFDLKQKEEAMQAWHELLSINPNAKTPNGQLVSEFIKQFESESPQ